MAEPSSGLDPAYVTIACTAVAAVFVAMSGVVAILWRAFYRQVQELRCSNRELRAEVKDLVERIRRVEDDSRREAQEHKAEMGRHMDKWFHLLRDWLNFWRGKHGRPPSSDSFPAAEWSAVEPKTPTEEQKESFPK